MQELWGAGNTVAGYRLRRLIGEGSHGSVFLATDALDRPVALKLLRLPPRSAGTQVHDGFVQGARVARGLSHPHIVAVQAFGIEEGIAWLTMEFIAGTDLIRYTHSQRLLPEPTVALIGERVASALGYAHGLGIVHRDLKPANVLVDWTTDRIKLADFGLARAADASQTGTGVVLGSPAYMAPEQLAGEVPTPACDLYALGVMLFQLLAGRLPHEGHSMGELLRVVAQGESPDLQLLRPGMQPALTDLVSRLMAKRPSERPRSAAAVSEELHTMAVAIWPRPAN
jgi:serine/threonine-protein kinase